MNSTQIATNLENLFLKPIDKETFIYDLLLAYGIPNASITRLQKGGLNLSKTAGEIDWKTKMFFKALETDANVHEVMATLRETGKALKHKPRFVVVTNYVTFLAFDIKTDESLDIIFNDLAKHYDFFLPWAGMEKATHQYENPADVKAAEKMAKLYDEIRKENEVKSVEDVHNLNVFLSRLLFCFFAEDTGIFEKNQFTHDIKDHTQPDGNDLAVYLDRLFELMNTPQREPFLPQHLQDFPYVNGGLFRNKHHAPVFTKRSRAVLIECGELDWAAINPDIFGSMIQAVITPEHRGGMGMHYTSVPNIMKVIEPLFLNELQEEFENGKYEPRRLNKLLDRIGKIKIFDPACGSGNFLIIAYKELRLLEIRIIQQLQTLQKAATGFEPKQLELIPKPQLTLAAQFQVELFSRVHLFQFYGIELDDFAHEIAILSLWLAEHQMNQAFFKQFGRTKPALPLKETGNIVHGNATRLDWKMVCPANESNEIYILGNPPYLGSSMQSAEQKADMALVFAGIKDYKNLDYIACWFLKGAKFIQNQNAQFAFVSTNSICQGEQVALLWTHVFNRNLEIGFAHTSFKWVNNARANAAVIVIIVGIKNISNKSKFIYANNTYKLVSNINPYLSEGKNIVFERRAKSISRFPEMLRGSTFTDNGNLTLNSDEKNRLIEAYPNSSKFIRRAIGSIELIRGLERWAILIKDEDLEEALEIPAIKERLEKVREFRLLSSAESTVDFANKPHIYKQYQHKESNAIIVPRVSSIRRDYIPIGFESSDCIILDSAQAIYNSELFHFSVINSHIHMVWVEATAGRLKTDFRYSSAVCYNHFPFPPISENQKSELQKHVFNIIAAREEHSEKTLAQLYDPDKMPDALREAHHQNDLAIERCYRSKSFESDEERLEYLFKQYELMIEQEKTAGTLFAGEKKGKKKK